MLNGGNNRIKSDSLLLLRLSNILINNGTLLEFTKNTNREHTDSRMGFNLSGGTVVGVPFNRDKRMRRGKKCDRGKDLVKW